MIKAICQRDISTLPWMTVCVNRNLDAGVAELLRHILDRGVVLVQLDGRIAVTQVMNPVRPQPRVFTHASVNNIEPEGANGWPPPTEYDLGYVGLIPQHGLSNLVSRSPKAL
jgi:hypothetical protein